MSSTDGAATLRDVAKLVGLSVATVSSALNGSGRVSSATRERVAQAASALNYVPNLAARSLNGVKTDVIGIVVTALSPSSNEIVWGVNEGGREQGRQLLLATTERDAANESRRIRDLAGGLADAIVLIAPISTPAELRPLRSLNVPVVVVNYRNAGAGLPAVFGENVAGSAEITRHLIGLGHTRIAFANGHPGSGQSQERERGYRLAMTQASLPIDETLVFDGDWTRESGLLVAEKILELGSTGPTAVFGANDQIARGLVETFSAAGKSVPGDYSVAGFDGAPMERLRPELTTVHHRFREIGMTAARLAGRLIEASPEDRAAAADTAIEVPSDLSVNDSTAAPRGAA